VLLDLSESLASRFGIKKSATIRNILLIPLSALVALTLIWYFVPPIEAIQGLFTSLPVTAFFLVLWTASYLELAFLGRKFCTSVCPYAMLQNALFDNDTLVIEYDRSRDDTCMKCDECVRACPVGIDIKQGLSTRCIACAECIDACLLMSEKRNLPPFPDYKGRLIRPKTFWMGGITLATGFMLIMLLALRPMADFLITRDQESLPEGLNRYSWTIYNNSGKTLDLELSAVPDVTIIGEHRVMVKPFQLMRGKVLLKAKGRPQQVRFTLKGSGISISKKTGFL
ncbi:MAG: 4Fe-4S dicluster domain-containing protein, partial [Chlorobiaceae bacterium]|nr:4Fe-4S dicluster domain-containing protein [Chlorobiaceae bacterium]